MAPCKPVKILDHCTVAPPPGSVAMPIADIPLTFFDQLWLPLPSSQTIHYYDYPYPLPLITQSLIPQIKLSLSCTLIHFYPLAGKISWPHDSYRPLIRYGDGDSVSVTIAESDADFNLVTSDHPRDATESHPFVPDLQSAGPFLPVLAIQITIFPNFGLSIGMTTNHSMIDGRSIAHFMRTWALMSKLGDATKSLSIESPPFLDRTVIKDPTGIEKIYLNELERFMGTEFVSGNRNLRVMDVKLQPEVVRATMELNPTDLRRLKDWVLARHNKVQQPEPIHISTYVVTCAFAWICLLKAEAAATEHEPDNNMIHTQTHFNVNLDCRARMKMDPPIPGTYFGNCIRPFMVTTEKNNLLREDGVVVASQLIGEAIQRVNKDVLRGQEDSISNLLRLESGRVFAAAGSPRAGLYGVDYGWGRPKKVEFVSSDRMGCMFMKESRKLDGGMEIDFAFNKKEMDAFASLFNGLRLIFD
ncbi:hypothetical protein NE237_009309 [Protea cynaroides]|uniref:Uncharacterized protein n=1 Tax=Protea cynaroides TaxID=273540 RepID=A0A9Q0KXP8_9MAGN|nr:hypothetical protein NE237_009309 [Protea cynaroides]